MHVQIWWGKLLENSNLEDQGVVRLIFRCIWQRITVYGMVDNCAH